MALRRQYVVKMGSDVLDGITASGADPGFNVWRPVSDGNADSYFAAVVAQSPMMSWASQAIGKALGFTGLASRVADVTIFDAKIGDDAELASGSVHTKHVMSSALILPRVITLPSRGDGSISYDAYGFSTSAAPLKSSINQALGAYTPGNEELYGLGPWSINGNLITSLTEVRISIEWVPVFDLSDSAIYPKQIAIRSRLFSIALVTNDSANLVNTMTAASGSEYDQALCLNGTTGLKGFAKRRACGGSGFAALDSAVHVQFNALDGVVTQGRVSDQDRRSAILISPRRESTGAMSFDTQAVIA